MSRARWEGAGSRHVGVLWAELAFVAHGPRADTTVLRALGAGCCDHPTFQMKNPRSKEVLPGQELGSAEAECPQRQPVGTVAWPLLHSELG